MGTHHYILIKDYQEKSHRLTDYAELLNQNVDHVTAASRAFGDLQKLQFALETYVRQGSFSYFKMPVATEVDNTAFKVRLLTPVQADALRADFLAYEQRILDARSLLDHVLRVDPKNVSAHETMGFLEFREGHIDEAKKWYAQAVQLDSQSYLAHYYFAAMSMNGSLTGGDDAQVEASLRAAIKLNPSFAPAFDTLAVFLGSRHRNLDEARRMGLSAVTLDPGNVGYRINVANVLLAMEHATDAMEVLRNAAKLAKSPQEVQTVDNFLMHAQEYAAGLEQRQHMMEQAEAAGQTPDQVGNLDASPVLHRDAFVPHGPHRFVRGTVKSVRCDSAAEIDLTVDSGDKGLALHADNYYKIQFTALNFTPNGDLNPCKDLEGKPAKVEYVESTDKSATPRALAIEIQR